MQISKSNKVFFSGLWGSSYLTGLNGSGFFVTVRLKWWFQLAQKVSPTENSISNINQFSPRKKRKFFDYPETPRHSVLRQKYSISPFLLLER